MEKARNVSTGPLAVYSDSELLVKQLTLEYRVKNERLIKLYFRSKTLLDRFETWEIRHVSRGDNRKADILSKQALKQSQ
ncbi:MAG: reverse transcriptase-like protein [Fidelibacterota bacterium]